MSTSIYSRSLGGLRDAELLEAREIIAQLKVELLDKEVQLQEKQREVDLYLQVAARVSPEHDATIGYGSDRQLVSERDAWRAEALELRERVHMLETMAANRPPPAVQQRKTPLQEQLTWLRCVGWR